MAELLLPDEANSAADIQVSQGEFRKQIASAITAIRAAMGAGDFSPEAGMELAQRLLTSQFIIYVDPNIGKDTFVSGIANDQTKPPLLKQQLVCGYSPFAPFKTIARAMLEVARISIITGADNDIYDRVVVSVANGEHIVENRSSAGLMAVQPWADGYEPDTEELRKFNSSTRAGLILPRGVSVLGIDLRKTVVRPEYVPPSGNNPSTGRAAIFRTTGGGFFFTFTFKDKIGEDRSHHLLHCFEFCSEKDLIEYYRKVVIAFSIGDTAEVRQGESQIVGPYPDSPIPDTDTTVGSSSYVFSCSLRSDYAMSGMFLDGSEVTGFKSMVTAQFTQVSLQKDMNAWQVYNNGTWAPPADYDAYIAANINDVRTRIGGEYNAKTGCYADDWRGFGFKCINGAIIQEVSCFVIGQAIHHWTASGGECTITNSNSNFGMTALMSSGFRGIGTGEGAFPQDSGFLGIAIKRPLRIRQDGLGIRQIEIGTAQSFDPATGVLTLQQNLRSDEDIVSRYSLKPGTYIWVDNRSRETGPGFDPTGVNPSVALPASGLLDTPAWDENKPNEVRIVPGNTNIDTIDPAELVNNRVYIRRLVDTRKPEERQVALFVTNTDVAGSRRPVGNYVVRLSGKTTPQDQLDPTNGAQQTFLVSSSTISSVPDSIVATGPVYRLILRPADSGENYSSNRYYRVGTPLYAQGRVYRAKREGKHPSFDEEIFVPSNNMLPSQRGVEYGRTGIGSILNLDGDYSDDPRSKDLGVDLDTQEEIVSQIQSNVDYLALEGFMRAVGYADSDIVDILRPQIEEDRWWRPDDATAPTPNGKLSSRVAWPLEFNRPSLIRAFGHAYEWAGQSNYSKALPKFQVTSLSDQHKVDFFAVNHLGGRCYNTGFNEDGLLIQGNTISDLATNRELNTEVAGLGGLAGDEALLEKFPTEFSNLTVTGTFSSTGKTDLTNTTLNGIVDGAPDWQPGTLPEASQTKAGIIRIATKQEAETFAADNVAITPATLVQAVGSAVKGVANLRISLRGDTPFQSKDAISSNLYIHPFNGSEIALYSKEFERWSVADFNNILTISLAPCTVANRNYDVYIYNKGTTLNPSLDCEFVQWPQDRSAPRRSVFDGITCKENDIEKRLVGVVRTESPGTSRIELGGVIPATRSDDYPRIGISNLTNKFTASMRFFFGTNWQDKSNSWGSPPPYAVRPRCEFVSATDMAPTAFLDLYSNPTDPKANNGTNICYVAPGIDSYKPPSDAFYGEVGTPASNQTVGSQWSRSLSPGFHYISYLYRHFGSSNSTNTINEHAAHGMIVTVQV